MAVAAAFVLASGIVQVVPSLAEIVFARPVVDPAVESLAGVLLLIIAATEAVLAADPDRSSTLVWIVVAGGVLSALDTSCFWAIGAYGTATAFVPVAVDLALSVWIATALVRVRRAPSSRRVRE